MNVNDTVLDLVDLARRPEEAIDWVTRACQRRRTPLELAHLRKAERPHGLPAGTRQRHRRSGGRSQWIDVEYSDFGLRVELDGRVGHVDDGVFRDRTRDNASAIEGFTTLRFGWADVYHDACATAGQTAAVLESRGWTGRARRCGRSCPLP